MRRKNEKASGNYRIICYYRADWPGDVRHWSQRDVQYEYHTDRQFLNSSERQRLQCILQRHIPDQQQIAQLQALVKQYQARETQYQTELKQAAQQLSQANQLAFNASQQVQNYQQILTQLQQTGLIRIDQNGQITINRSNRRDNNNQGGLFGGNS